MKQPTKKGLSGTKSFSRYSGNVKSSSDGVPKSTLKTPAGGKTKSNALKVRNVRKPTK